MRKLSKFLAIILSCLLLSCTVIGCSEPSFEGRPDYSKSDAVANIWAYGQVKHDWYQLNGIRYYLDESLQTPERTQMLKDANFTMVFINYSFTYNTLESDFDTTPIKKVMDMCYELDLPCFAFNNTLHGLSSKENELNINKDKALKEINAEYTSREYFFDAYDYCVTSGHAKGCTECTDEKLDASIKEKFSSLKAVEEINIPPENKIHNVSRTYFYNEDDLDAYVALSMKGLKDHPAFRGVSLKDEPFWHTIPAVGEIYRSVVRVCNNDDVTTNDNPHIMCNALPFNIAEYHKNYFSPNGKDLTSEQAYLEYLESYYEHIAQYAGYLQYDDYPILNDGQLWPTYLQNHQIVSDFCKEKGIERRMVMQTTAYGQRRAPLEGDIYWQSNVSQAFGNKEFSYYEYYPTINTGGDTVPNENSYIVKANGEPNERYKWVTDVNAEILFNHKALSHFEYQGMQYKIKAPMPGAGYTNGIHTDEMKLLKDYDFTVNVQTGGMVLITELYDKENDQYGYYVVNATNPAYASELVVTLDFGDKKYAQIYQNNTVTDAVSDGGKVNVYLGTGRGAFVMPY